MQMYFEDDPYNKTDPFLNSSGEAGRQELLVRRLLARTVSRSRTGLKNGDLRHSAVQRIDDETVVEKHAATRRSWRKLHIGVDADTGQIIAAEARAPWGRGRRATQACRSGCGGRMRSSLCWCQSCAAVCCVSAPSPRNVPSFGELDAPTPGCPRALDLDGGKAVRSRLAAGAKGIRTHGPTVNGKDVPGLHNGHRSRAPELKAIRSLQRAKV
jgi:hypothetical protein